MLCLGAKTPPVDLDIVRVIDMFESAPFFKARVTRVATKSHLVSLYYNSDKIWHQNFDFLLPLYQTMTRDGGFSRDREIWVPKGQAAGCPMTTAALSNYPVKNMRNSVCWDDITMGMVKVTDRKRNATEPPYSFCSNCTSGLRSAALRYYNMSDDRPRALVFLRREGNTRRIVNSDALLRYLKGVRRDIEMVEVFFENATIVSQVELISRAEVLVSIHGSGLANCIWMKHGSLLVEIVPPNFTHNDWYAKVAAAAGLRYHRFEGDRIHGVGLGYALNKCWAEDLDMTQQPCHDALRDQNTVLDMPRFRRELGKMIKGKA
jgi:hypothetical protein